MFVCRSWNRGLLVAGLALLASCTRRAGTSEDGSGTAEDGTGTSEDGSGDAGATTVTDTGSTATGDGSSTGVGSGESSESGYPPEACTVWDDGKVVHDCIGACDDAPEPREVWTASSQGVTAIAAAEDGSILAGGWIAEDPGGYSFPIVHMLDASLGGGTELDLGLGEVFPEPNEDMATDGRVVDIAVDENGPFVLIAGADPGETPTSWFGPYQEGLGIDWLETIRGNARSVDLGPGGVLVAGSFTPDDVPDGTWDMRSGMALYGLSGAQLWRHIDEHSFIESGGFDAKQNESGEIIATGWANFDGSSQSGWLRRYDVTPTMIWEATDAELGGRGVALAPTPDDGVVVLAATGWYHETNAALLEYDATGTLLWSTSIDVERLTPSDVVRREDGALFLLGGIWGDPSDASDAAFWLAEADASGEIVWQRTLMRPDCTGPATGGTLVLTSDGSIYASGVWADYGGPMMFAWVQRYAK